MNTKIAFVGDYWPQEEFSRVDHTDGEMWIANLECAFSARREQAVQKAHAITFPWESLELIKKAKVAAFNVANNHVGDAGENAFCEAIEHLRTFESIQFYGTKDQPFATLKSNNKRVAIIGGLEKCRARGPSLFRLENVTKLITKLRESFDRIYVTPHWGKEGELAHHPSLAQRRLATEWIRCGADGIFGHHPHTMHSSELIQDKPVFYSIGNHQFDHVEGRTYMLSRIGLKVVVDLNDSGDYLQRSFTLFRNGVHHEVPSTLRHRLNDFLCSLQEDLSQLSGLLGSYRWAQFVGPTYIKKNGISWRARLTQDFRTTLPYWLIWNILPQTCLLRLGALFPNRGFIARLKDLESALRTWEQQQDAKLHNP